MTPKKCFMVLNTFGSYLDPRVSYRERDLEEYKIDTHSEKRNAYSLILELRERQLPLLGLLLFLLIWLLF